MGRRRQQAVLQEQAKTIRETREKAVNRVDRKLRASTGHWHKPLTALGIAAGVMLTVPHDAKTLEKAERIAVSVAAAAPVLGAGRRWLALGGINKVVGKLRPEVWEVNRMGPTDFPGRFNVAGVHRNSQAIYTFLSTGSGVAGGAVTTLGVREGMAGQSPWVAALGAGVALAAAGIIHPMFVEGSTNNEIYKLAQQHITNATLYNNDGYRVHAADLPQAVPFSGPTEPTDVHYAQPLPYMQPPR